MKPVKSKRKRVWDLNNKLRCIISTEGKLTQPSIRTSTDMLSHTYVDMLHTHIQLLKHSQHMHTYKHTHTHMHIHRDTCTHRETNYPESTDWPLS